MKNKLQFLLTMLLISVSMSAQQLAFPGEGLTWDTSELYTTGKLKVVGDAEGIESASSAASPLRVEYYSLSGQRNRSVLY